MAQCAIAYCALRLTRIWPISIPVSTSQNDERPSSTIDLTTHAA
jgi:hypothetical protein